MTDINNFVHDFCITYGTMKKTTAKIIDLDLDFDQAMELAKSNPAAFEARRKAAIEALIERAPARQQQHLRRLQWRIDMVRDRAANPMASCVKIYKMMWESLAGERGLIAALKHADKVHAEASEAAMPSAQILAFKSPNETQSRSEL